MGLIHSPRIVSNGLVLALDAGNTKSYPGSGTTWYDTSGNINHGTLTGGPTFDSTNGGQILFDGVNDYIEGTNISGLTGDLTAEIWVKILSVPTPTNWVRIFGKGDSTLRTFGLWINSSISTVAFLYQRYGLSNLNLYSSNYPSLNTWYCLTLTSSGSSHAIYINGISKGTSTVTGTFHDSTQGYRIGFGEPHTYGNINVANAKIYNRGLSDTEVSQNFNALRGRFGL